MDDDSPRVRGRRWFLRTGAAAGIAGLAGCGGTQNGTETDRSGSGGSGSDGTGDGSGSGGGSGSGSGGGSSGDPPSIGSGSPFGDRQLQGGTRMSEMPPLEGELVLYSGRGEPLVGELLAFLEELYPDFTVRPRYNSAAELVNQLLTEGGSSPADVFFSVNAGALGAVKDRDRTQALPDDVLSMVPDNFQDPDGQWVGTSGRARAIPYNTEQLGEGDIPTDIMAFPDADVLQGEMGWAPTYSSFQAFVTAMRILEGESATREWLRGMQAAGVTAFSDEFLVSQAVADGEIAAGLANHYYTLRVQAGRPNAPIDLAFTSDDAGAIFNVAGAATLDTASDRDLADNFVRHLLSAEAQDYFARTTFEYPLVPEVDPVGRLPGIDELNPPDGLDLTQLSDLEGTIDLLREVGVL